MGSIGRGVVSDGDIAVGVGFFPLRENGNLGWLVRSAYRVFVWCDTSSKISEFSVVEESPSPLLNKLASLRFSVLSLPGHLVLITFQCSEWFTQAHN